MTDPSRGARSDSLRSTLLTRLRMRSLLVFATVMQSGGVTRAAEALDMSQPAVTRTMRELEEMIGSPLFRKAGRRRVPTEAANALYRHARRFLSEVRATAEDLMTGEGRVRVGVLLAAAPSLLPNAILLSKGEAPNVRIRVIDGAADTLLPALAAGEIDVVIGRISPFAQRRGLQHEVLYDEPIVVCARPRHPIFRPSKRNVTLGEIARYPWILPPAGVSLRQEIDNALERANVTAPDDLVESVSILTNRALVMKGDVLAFLPANVVAEDVRLGLIKTLPPPFDIAVDPVGLTFRDDGDLSAHALAFIACVRRAARR